MKIEMPTLAFRLSRIHHCQLLFLDVVMKANELDGYKDILRKCSAVDISYLAFPTQNSRVADGHVTFTIARYDWLRSRA